MLYLPQTLEDHIFLSWFLIIQVQRPSDESFVKWCYINLLLQLQNTKLPSLDWFLADHKIQFKTCPTMYRVIYTGQPTYIFPFNPFPHTSFPISTPNTVDHSHLIVCLTSWILTPAY